MTSRVIQRTSNDLEFNFIFSSCINLKCFGHVRDKTQLRYTADYWTRDEIKAFGEMLQARIEAKSADQSADSNAEAHDEL